MNGAGRSEEKSGSVEKRRARSGASREDERMRGRDQKIREQRGRNARRRVTPADHSSGAGSAP